MSVEKKVPEIRFKGFSGDWQEKVISDLFTVTRGNVLAATKTSSVPTLEKRYPVYSSQTKNNGLMGFYSKYLFENAITWTTDGANAGTVNYREGKFYSTNVNGVLLSDEGYANNTVAEILNKEAWRHVSHVGNPKLMNNVMSEININVPNSAEEQTQIGNYFQKLDSLINQHQQQHDQLSNIKKAMLEKMFPKPGETIPKIRFKEFSGEWEESAICDLFTVTRGNVLAATKTSPVPTPEKCYPVYSSQTKNNGLMGFYNRYLFENAITWTTDGANAGTVNFREGRFYSTNVNGVLLSDKGYANKAIAEILNKEAWKHVSHVGNPKLMNNVMSAIKITVPTTIEEQTAIGNYFQKLDALINQHQQQITKLTNIKQAFLSKMFV